MNIFITIFLSYVKYRRPFFLQARWVGLCLSFPPKALRVDVAIYPVNMNRYNRWTAKSEDERRLHPTKMVGYVDLLFEIRLGINTK